MWKDDQVLHCEKQKGHDVTPCLIILVMLLCLQSQFYRPILFQFDLHIICILHARGEKFVLWV